MFLTVTVWLDHSIASHLRGWCSAEFGPFDEPGDVLEQVEIALGARWRRATADEVMEHLNGRPEPLQPAWEQLPLFA
jgi:hypothetical protein